MAAARLATALRTLFLAIVCVFGAIYISSFYTGGSPVNKEIYKPWFNVALVEIYINVIAVAFWIVYKESNFVYAAMWIFPMCWTGSITTFTYISIHFFKLSPEESAQDPIYHVLLRPEHKGYHEEQKGKKNSSALVVVAARIAFISLGCLQIATVIYAVLADGSPFCMEVFVAPWVMTQVIDAYFHIVALLVWVAYTESSWLSTSIWIVLFICFSSVTTCAYIATQLFRIRCQDPVYLVLLKHKNRAARVMVAAAKV